MLVVDWKTVEDFCNALQTMPCQYVKPITKLVEELTQGAKFEEERKRNLSNENDDLKSRIGNLTKRMKELEELAEKNMEEQYREFCEKENADYEVCKC